MVRDAREHALAGWVCRTDRLTPWCAPRGGSATVADVAQVPRHCDTAGFGGGAAAAFPVIDGARRCWSLVIVRVFDQSTLGRS